MSSDWAPSNRKTEVWTGYKITVENVSTESEHQLTTMYPQWPDCNKCATLSKRPITGEIREEGLRELCPWYPIFP